MKLAIAFVALVAAQSAPPVAEVVSIKQNRSGAPTGNLRVSPGGRYEWTNTTLKGLIGSVHQRFAFDHREIDGGPDWIDRTRFDVMVQTSGGAPPNDPDGFPGPLFAIVRAVLQERFGLVTHNEMRERAIYRLVRVRRDGPLGSGLRPVSEGCVDALKTLTAGASRPEPRKGRGPDCTFGGPPGELQGNAVTIDMLSRVIGAQVRRPVVNETGIAGSFDVDLTFSPEFVQGPPGTQPPGPPPIVPADAASIFTAVQEQLGLRLEASRGPVDVLIVDRAERPAELRRARSKTGQGQGARRDQLCLIPEPPAPSPESYRPVVGTAPPLANSRRLNQPSPLVSCWLKLRRVPLYSSIVNRPSSLVSKDAN